MGKDEHCTTFCESYKQSVQLNTLQEAVGCSHFKLQITMAQSQHCDM